MKVILTGATGFIGGEVLIQALAHPSITSLVVLTRRALPESATSNPKLKVITLADFLSYPPEILSQLEGAESCIWYVYAASLLVWFNTGKANNTNTQLILRCRAMGKPAHKAPNLEASRMVEVHYMLAGAEAFFNSLAPALKSKGKTFRFVLLGAMFACREPNKHLWFLHNSRMIKGEAENGIHTLQEKEGSNVEVTIVRPGGGLPKGTLIPNFMVAPTFSIKVDELAAVMVDEAVAGASGTRTIECDALRDRGRELLKGSR